MASFKKGEAEEIGRGLFNEGGWLFQSGRSLLKKGRTPLPFSFKRHLCLIWVKLVWFGIVWRTNRNSSLLPLDISIWRFPEMGVRCSAGYGYHPFIDGIFHKPTGYWGTPMTMETPIYDWPTMKHYHPIKWERNIYGFIWWRHLNGNSYEHRGIFIF